LFGKWGHPGLGAVKLIGLNYHGVETVDEKQDLQLNHQKEKNIMMSQLSHQSMKSLHNRCSAKRVGLQLLFHLMKTMEWVVERK
jgi:hypothetical protein